MDGAEARSETGAQAGARAGAGASAGATAVPRRIARGPSGRVAVPHPFALLAVIAVVALAALYALSRAYAPVAVRDIGAVTSIDPRQDPRLYAGTSELLRTIDVNSLLLFGVGIAGLALARRRLDLALGAAATIVGANVTTQVLKPLLGTLDPVGGDAGRALHGAFPSGHATVAMSLGLALVLAAPTRFRLLGAFAGAGYAAAIGAALIALGWHYPSDVAGGYLVALAWVAGVAGVIYRGRPLRGEALAARLPSVSPTVVIAAAVVLAGAYSLAVTVAAIRRPDLFVALRANALPVAAAAALAALSAVLFATVVVTLRGVSARGRVV